MVGEPQMSEKNLQLKDFHINFSIKESKHCSESNNVLLTHSEDSHSERKCFIGFIFISFSENITSKLSFNLKWLMKSSISYHSKVSNNVQNKIIEFPNDLKGFM